MEDDTLGHLWQTYFPDSPQVEDDPESEVTLKTKPSSAYRTATQVMTPEALFSKKEYSFFVKNKAKLRITLRKLNS